MWKFTISLSQQKQHIWVPNCKKIKCKQEINKFKATSFGYKRIWWLAASSKCASNFNYFLLSLTEPFPLGLASLPHHHTHHSTWWSHSLEKKKQETPYFWLVVQALWCVSPSLACLRCSCAGISGRHLHFSEPVCKPRKSMVLLYLKMYKYIPRKRQKSSLTPFCVFPTLSNFWKCCLLNPSTSKNNKKKQTKIPQLVQRQTKMLILFMWTSWKAITCSRTFSMTQSSQRSLFCVCAMCHLKSFNAWTECTCLCTHLLIPKHPPVL